MSTPETSATYVTTTYIHLRLRFIPLHCSQRSGKCLSYDNIGWLAVGFIPVLSSAMTLDETPNAFRRITHCVYINSGVSWNSIATASVRTIAAGSNLSVSCENDVLCRVVKVRRRCPVVFVLHSTDPLTPRIESRWIDLGSLDFTISLKYIMI